MFKFDDLIKKNCHIIFVYEDILKQWFIISTPDHEISSGKTLQTGNTLIFCNDLLYAGAPGENPRKHRENLQTPHRKTRGDRWIQTQDLLGIEAAVLNSACTTMLPNLLNYQY